MGCLQVFETLAWASPGTQQDRLRQPWLSASHDAEARPRERTFDGDDGGWTGCRPASGLSSAISRRTIHSGKERRPRWSWNRRLGRASLPDRRGSVRPGSRRRRWWSGRRPGRAAGARRAFPMVTSPRASRCPADCDRPWRPRRRGAAVAIQVHAGGWGDAGQGGSCADRRAGFCAGGGCVQSRGADTLTC